MRYATFSVAGVQRCTFLKMRVNTGGWKPLSRKSPCSHFVPEARAAGRAFTRGLGFLSFFFFASPWPLKEKLEIQDAASG